MFGTRNFASNHTPNDKRTCHSTFRFRYLLKVQSPRVSIHLSASTLNVGIPTLHMAYHSRSPSSTRRVRRGLENDVEVSRNTAPSNMCIHINIYIYIYIYIYVYAYTCMHVYIYIYIYVYIHTYIFR